MLNQAELNDLHRSVRIHSEAGLDVELNAHTLMTLIDEVEELRRKNKS